jgi:hypothetical protein
MTNPSNLHFFDYAYLDVSISFEFLCISYF